MPHSNAPCPRCRPSDLWVGGDQFFLNNSNSGRYRAVVLHWDGTTWSSR